MHARDSQEPADNQPKGALTRGNKKMNAEIPMV